MKKKFLILIVALVLAFAVGCANNTDKDDPTEAPATATPEPTEAGPTAEPTATPEPKPTLPPMDDDEKGKPQEDAEVLIREDFEDGDIDPDEFTLRAEEYIEISDGYMNITEVWSAVSPNYLYG